MEDEFDTWYANYPHKVCKGQARTAFEKARRRADMRTLQAGLERYIRDKPPQFAWCNPATWLNGERWADEPQHVGGDNAKTGNVIPAADRLIERVRAFDEPAPVCNGTGAPAVRLISSGRRE